MKTIASATALFLLLQVATNHQQQTGAPMHPGDRVGKWTGKVVINRDLGNIECQYTFYKPDGKTPDITYFRAFPKGVKTCPKTIGFAR